MQELSNDEKGLFLGFTVAGVITLVVLVAFFLANFWAIGVAFYAVCVVTLAGIGKHYYHKYLEYKQVRNLKKEMKRL